MKSPGVVVFAVILSVSGLALSDGFETGSGDQSAGADPDGDGLVNWMEDDFGTDRSDSDTDADGIPDGWEAANWLDPLDSSDAFEDADSDGMSNYDEYLQSCNPQSVDTDSDGLEDIDDPFPTDPKNGQSSSSEDLRPSADISDYPGPGPEDSTPHRGSGEASGSSSVGA